MLELHTLAGFPLKWQKQISGHFWDFLAL